MGFSRQEYRNGLLCPPPGDLPNRGIKPRSPALQEDSLPSEPPGKPINGIVFPISFSDSLLLVYRNSVDSGTSLVVQWLRLCFHCRGQPLKPIHVEPMIHKGSPCSQEWTPSETKKKFTLDYKDTLNSRKISAYFWKCLNAKRLPFWNVNVDLSPRVCPCAQRVKGAAASEMGIP